MRVSVALLMLLTTAVFSSAQAQTPKDFGVKTLVLYEGECRFQLKNEFTPCDDKVAYGLLENGKALVFFMKGDYVFTMVGNSDRQPNLENYYLAVNKFIINEGGEQKAEDPDFEGECHFSLNRDATKFYFIRCDVYDRGKGYMFKFYLEKIRGFEKKDF